ncbi:hypothetical protein L9F63_020692, partial [Diploptera punctata]
GVKPVDKREGGGAHNWGNHRDDIEELNTSHSSEDQHDWAADKPEGENQQTADSTETKDVEIGGTGETGELESAPPMEEEPRELTLDEYKALRGNRQKPTYNIRKAGEGEDLTQWKKMYALKKKEGEEEEEEEEEYDASEYPQRVGRQKHLLDIDIHFADSRGEGTRVNQGTVVNVLEKEVNDLIERGVTGWTTSMTSHLLVKWTNFSLFCSLLRGQSERIFTNTLSSDLPDVEEKSDPPNFTWSASRVHVLPPLVRPPVVLMSRYTDRIPCPPPRDVFCHCCGISVEPGSTPGTHLAAAVRPARED